MRVYFFSPNDFFHRTIPGEEHARVLRQGGTARQDAGHRGTQDEEREHVLGLSLGAP